MSKFEDFFSIKRSLLSRFKDEIRFILLILIVFKWAHLPSDMA